MIRKVLIATSAALASLSASADKNGQCETIRFNVRYPVSVSVLKQDVDSNASHLAELRDWLSAASADSTVTVTAVEIGGSASPEGPVANNHRLARARSKALRGWLGENSRLDSATELIRGREAVDWPMLLELVAASEMDGKDDVVSTIKRASATLSDPTEFDSRCQSELMRLNGGLQWSYMLKNFFPQMRYACAIISTVRRPSAPAIEPEIVEAPASGPDTIVEAPPTILLAEPAATENSRKPFYMDVRSNMLYDLAFVPNLGLEFYLGKRWSIATNWAWAWWSRNAKHRYWRVFGGELNLRYWFGKQAEAKPLSGHHAGIYGEAFTFDLELSGKGYIGGRPGGGMLSHPAWNVGVEYGFSLPIAKRVNIDFTIGVGYFHSTLYEYTPIDTHYVWQATKRRRWVGPTKAEVSLVWLIGRGNYNKKGGAR